MEHWGLTKLNEWYRLTPNDKKLFEDYKKDLGIYNWVYSWEYLRSRLTAKRPFHYIILEGNLCIFNKRWGNAKEKSINLFYVPLGKNNIDVLDKCFKEFKNQRVIFIYDGFKSQYEMKERAPDVVYELKDLIKLEGHKYKNARNSINKFKKDNDFFWRKASIKDKQSIQDLYQKWAKNKLSKCYVDIYNRESVEIGIEYAIYDIPSFVVEIEGEIKGFVCGNELVEDWCFCFLRFCDNRFYGLSDFMFWNFYREMFEKGFKIGNDAEYIDKNLHKFKDKFNPAKVIGNYMIDRRKQEVTLESWI